MGTKLNIKKGEWISSESNYTNNSGTQRVIDISCASVEEFITVWTGNDRTSDDDLLIAKIICDAGNTYQSTGKLPSELASDKDLLVYVLKEIRRRGNLDNTSAIGRLVDGALKAVNHD